MTDFNALIEQLGFGFRTAPCGFAGGTREAKPPRMQPRMIPGGAAARELCQLVVDFVDPLHAMVDEELLLADLKLDGIRAHHIDGMIVSREGTPLNCARHCLPALARLEEAYGYKTVFDGEYLEDGGFEATNSAFKRGEGQGVFWIFDAAPFAEWVRNRSTERLMRRRERLEQRGRAAACPSIGILVPRMVRVPGEARRLADHVIAAAAEGLVVKDPDGFYMRGRNADWRRMKQVKTFDCPIIDVLQPPSAETGRAVVLVRGPHGPLKITIAGVSMRQLFGGWKETVIEIAFNRTDAGKPRHARFVRFRDDKKEVSHG